MNNYLNTGARSGKTIRLCAKIIFDVVHGNYSKDNPYKVCIVVAPNKSLESAEHTKKNIENILKSTKTGIEQKVEINIEQLKSDKIIYDDLVGVAHGKA